MAFVCCMGRWAAFPSMLLMAIQTAGAQAPNTGPHNVGAAKLGAVAAVAAAPAASASLGPALLPSSTLRPFLDTNLGTIVAPLDAPGFSQPEAIAAIKASYADGLAAAPANRQAAYLAAEKVCAALEAAVTERQTALTALRGGAASGPDDSLAGSQKNAWAQRAEVLRQNIAALYLQERELERQAK